MIIDATAQNPPAKHDRIDASNCPFLSHWADGGAVLKRVYD